MIRKRSVLLGGVGRRNPSSPWPHPGRPLVRVRARNPSISCNHRCRLRVLMAKKAASGKERIAMSGEGAEFASCIAHVATVLTARSDYQGTFGPI